MPEKRSWPSEKSVSAASLCTGLWHDPSVGQRRSSTAHRPSPKERPRTIGHDRARVYLVHHAAWPYTLEYGTLEYGQPPGPRALCAARRVVFAPGATGPPTT